ncbi:DUF3429 domain-containing protein [Acetobacteraceae bacterium KSS8]|uniref:DUF3429 domain-containing protein n=1 Tax=Endosaccharibacter trunci TaxID=2812733 RepID=A0ABT1W9J8_9PROT|nr:DUF3429 domain-containing protein [Acetobacteraceae bacterium KSS8]
MPDRINVLDRAVEHPERRAALVLRVEEPRWPPLLGILLAHAAMVPILLGAIAFALVTVEMRPLVLGATITWGASVVLFLSGVRRGLSFRTPGGATVAQVSTSMALFGLGLLAFCGLWLPTPVPSLLLLLLAFAGMGVLDPIAARRGETPLYFAGLRPLQMALPSAALIGLIAMVLA